MIFLLLLLKYEEGKAATTTADGRAEMTETDRSVDGRGGTVLPAYRAIRRKT